MVETTRCRCGQWITKVEWVPNTLWIECNERGVGGACGKGGGKMRAKWVWDEIGSVCSG